MKLKVFFTSIIASASFLTTGNINPVFAGSCEGAPDTGTLFKWTGPGTWKIMTTVRQPISSANERKVEFAFKKLDLKAQRDLAQWLSTNVKSGSKLTTSEKETFVIGANDEASEEALEGFNELVEEFSSSTEALLVGMVNIGRCHTLGEEVRLTKGINSENIAAAQNMKNQNFDEGTQSNSSNNSTQTYRNDLNQGYSGYGNLENF